MEICGGNRSVKESLRVVGMEGLLQLAASQNTAEADEFRDGLHDAMVAWRDGEADDDETLVVLQASASAKRRISLLEHIGGQIRALGLGRLFRKGDGG